MSQFRKNYIHDKWTIIATDRQHRPTDYADKSSNACPFCEGNEHLTPPETFSLRSPCTLPNTPGWTTRVVPNKYPAVELECQQKIPLHNKGIYQSITGNGVHEVIIDSPNHKKPWHKQSIEKLAEIIYVIQCRLSVIERKVDTHYILVFKNEGEYAGASLLHPHSQCMTLPVIPKRFTEQSRNVQQYYRSFKRCMLCDMYQYEKQNSCRMIYNNVSYSGFCPFASRFPFEIWILPKQHSYSFFTIAENNRMYLADILVKILKKLVSVMKKPQYNVVFYSLPSRDPDKNHSTCLGKAYHWRIEIIPRFSKLEGLDWGTGIYHTGIKPEIAVQYLLNGIGITTNQ